MQLGKIAYFSFVAMVMVCVYMSAYIVFAQENAAGGGTVRGQITDLTPAQNPIEGVEVKIVAQDGGKEFTTLTDADGNYKHAGLPTGRYLISISKERYDEPVGKPVTVVEGGDHFVPLKMVKKGNIDPLFEVQPLMSLPLHVVVNVARRYNLDEAGVIALHPLLLDSIKNVLEQGGSLHAIIKGVEEGSMSLLEVLLSYPDFKAALAKHLSEAQLQDYLDFTEVRRQRDQQVVARRIAMLIDKELSLTTEQREKIVKLLRGAAWNEAFPISMSVLRISSQQAIHLVHYRLKVSLDDLLSEVAVQGLARIG